MSIKLSYGSCDVKISNMRKKEYGVFRREIEPTENLNQKTFAEILGVSSNRVATLVKKGIINPETYRRRKTYKLEWIPRALYAMNIADDDGKNVRKRDWHTARSAVANFIFSRNVIVELGLEDRLDEVALRAVEKFGIEAVMDLGWLPEE